jgi:hypothetical protein
MVSKKPETASTGGESTTWARLGELLLTTESGDIKTLEKTIKDRETDSLFRCAALDRYVEIEGSRAMKLLEGIAKDWTDDESLRVLAHQWLRDPEVNPPPGEATTAPTTVHTRAAVRTRGAVRPRASRGGAEREERAKASTDPSPRVRWLQTLGD